MNYFYHHIMNQLGGAPPHPHLSHHHHRYQETLTKHHQDRFQEMQKSVNTSLAQLKPYDLVKSPGPVRYDSDGPQDLSLRYPPLRYSSPVYIKRELSPGGEPGPAPAQPPVPVKMEPEDPGYSMQELGHLYQQQHHSRPVAAAELIRSYSLPARDMGDHGDHGVPRQMSLDRSLISPSERHHGPSDRSPEAVHPSGSGKDEVNSSRTIIGRISEQMFLSVYYKATCKSLIIAFMVINKG